MRQETLFRGLVACFNALGFVPWVLVFDNMKTVTTGRDEHAQPIWHWSLLQLAAEFDFHPEACWPASGNQKGSFPYSSHGHSTADRCDITAFALGRPVAPTSRR